MLTIGCHLSISEGYASIVREAIGLKASTFAFFLRNPRGGAMRSLAPDDMAECRRLLADHHFGRLVAHAPYTLNPCAAKEGLREYAMTTMIEELHRLEELPGNCYNFHPGAHVGQGSEKGIELTADFLDHVLPHAGPTTVLIETMAGKHLEAFETASVSRQNEAYKRYSMISAAVSVIADKKHYTRLLDEASKLYSVSKQTLRKYLWEYLVYQDIACLLPAEKKKEGRELTADEKNFRRALNKWFYNQDQHSLKWTYRQMLKEKYCDPDGKLLSERPSFDQFRYYYRQSKSQQNYLISRNGLGDYQRNERPLLGDCIQSRFPNIGVGMLDGTVCDIYLVNQSGNVVGRPILTACIDANTSLCCGYCLSWEGGTYNLRNLMQNVIADKAEWCRKHNITIQKKLKII